MDQASNCFCHCQGSLKPVSKTGRPDQEMDLDCALNELGMLSTSVCDGQQKYLVDRRKKEMLGHGRERKFSEPISTDSSNWKPNGTDSSPNKKGYQIVQLNPLFVVNFSTEIGTPSPLKSDSVSTASLDNGEKYKNETVDINVNSNRLLKVRITRTKRLKKPYEVPLPQRHSIDTCYPSLNSNSTIDSSLPKSSHSDVNLCEFNVNSLYTIASDVFSNTSSIANGLDNSEGSENDKNDIHNTGNYGNKGHLSRSRSLDELDFSKLQLAESENISYIQEKREIEHMSNYLQCLNVNK